MVGLERTVVEGGEGECADGEGASAETVEVGLVLGKEGGPGVAKGPCTVRGRFDGGRLPLRVWRGVSDDMQLRGLQRRVWQLDGGP